MDRLIQLQQRQRPRSAIPCTARREEEDEDDVADFYQYVPRHRGDFPRVSYEPSDDAPQSTRYEILDREFEDDIPIYIIRPHVSKADREVAQEVEAQRSEDVAERSDNVQNELDACTSPSDALARTRVCRSRTTASARSTPVDAPLSYDPDDPTIRRVDLFDIYNHVTQRELERFEIQRFKNPTIEDFPVKVPLSEGSSVVAREERVQHRDEVKSVEPKRKPGRPFKKQKNIDHGPLVTIGSPRAASMSGGPVHTLELVEISDSEDTPASHSSDAHDHDDIAPTIEDTTDELDLLDMSTSLRGLGGSLGRNFEAQPRARSKPILNQRQISTRSVSRQPSSRSTEQKMMREVVALPSTKIEKQRGSHAKIVHNSAHSQASRRKTSQGSSASRTNGNMTSSASTSRSASHVKKQTTVDAYLKAKSTVKAANVHASLAHSQQTLRQSTQQSVIKTGGKMRAKMIDEQPASRHKSVQPIRGEQTHEAGVEDDSDGEEDEYEISHIVLHDDSRGERFYLVAWKGFPLEEATWLTERELKDAPDVLKAYRRALASGDLV